VTFLCRILSQPISIINERISLTDSINYQ